MNQPGTNINLPLDRHWGFQIDPDNLGLQERWDKKGLPAPARVMVPHTWNVDAETEEYRGLGWYEYRFQTPSVHAFNRVWLHFEAVYRDATVWINGEKMGSHEHSGYTAFRIEVTAFLKEGEDNLLVVAVDNRNSDLALPKANHFDWADDGGIIRTVEMVITGEAAIDYIKLEATPIISASGRSNPSGTINGMISMHDSLHSAPCEVQLDLTLRREGTTLWNGKQTAAFPCDSISLSEIKLEEVALWHFDHPHLYEMTIQLSIQGLKQDEKKVLLGFREFRAVGSQFWLNGEPVRLAGVEWMPGSHPLVGMAESEENRERLLRQLKHANCVLTRFHWQQDDKLLEWCDRNGVLVQEEIPLWQQPSEPGEETLPIAKQQAFEMIARHSHHPSVIAWGIGNELDGQSETTVEFVKQIKSYVEALDHSRLVNYVSNTVHLDPFKDATGAGDVIMWNDYIGTWHGEHDMNEVVGRVVADYPDKPIVVAEFGLCEPAFEGGDQKRIDILLEKTEIYRRYPNIAGFIFFSLNDYRTQMGEDGRGRMRQRVHGVTDIYGTEKPSYQVLRETASPLQMHLACDHVSGDLICRLKCRNDLPSYTVSGYGLAIESTDGIRKAHYTIPIMVPGDHCEITVSTNGLSGDLKLVLYRPTGFSVLEQQVNV